MLSNSINEIQALADLASVRLDYAKIGDWDKLVATEEEFHRLGALSSEQTFSDLELAIQAQELLSSVVMNEGETLKLIEPKLNELKEFLIQASRRPSHGFNKA